MMFLKLAWMTCSELTDLTNLSPQEDGGLSVGLEGNKPLINRKGTDRQYWHCRDNFKLRTKPNDKCGDWNILRRRERNKNKKNSEVSFTRIHFFRDEKLSSCGETVTQRPGVTSRKTWMLHHTAVGISYSYIIVSLFQFNIINCLDARRKTPPP